MVRDSGRSAGVVGHRWTGRFAPPTTPVCASPIRASTCTLGLMDGVHPSDDDPLAMDPPELLYRGLVEEIPAVLYVG